MRTRQTGSRLLKCRPGRPFLTFPKKSQLNLTYMSLNNSLAAVTPHRRRFLFIGEIARLLTA